MLSPQPLPLARVADVPLFRDLPVSVVAALLPHVFAAEFTAGQRILRAGEDRDGAYYLLDGHVEARLPAAAAPPRESTASMLMTELPVAIRAGEATVIGPGEIFGEGSALSRYPIAVDIRAVSAVSCVLIRTPALRAMFDVPELAAFKILFETRYRERTLRDHLRRVDVFAALQPSAIDRLADCADLVTFKPGKPIAIEGEPCDAFFLVRGGYVKVSVRAGVADVALTYLRLGDWVGEAALLLDEPWPFSLTAIEHVELVKIARRDLEALAPQAVHDRRLWDVMTERLAERGRAAANPHSSRPLQFAIDSGVIHGESVLLIDLERCTRCDECVRACADAHDGTPRFVREGLKIQNFSVPAACYQCSDPVCMIGCPTGAITRPLGTLEVAIDAASCIGCGNCVRRCPWGNITTVPRLGADAGASAELAVKCDLCLGRPEGPACVQMCPQGCAERVSFKDHARVAAVFAR